MRRFSNVLAATDFSAAGNRAAQTAFALVGGRGAVHLLHVMPKAPVPNPLYAHYMPTSDWLPEHRQRAVDAATRALQELVPEQPEEVGVDVELHVTDGAPAQVILELAAELKAEVIVVGMSGVGGLHERLLGNVVDRLLHKGHRALLVVP